MSTKSKNRRRKPPARGGKRAGAGRPSNAARIAIDLHRHLSARLTGEASTIYAAAKAVRDGMTRAAGDDPERVDRAEQVAEAARVSAYRDRARGMRQHEVRPDGGITAGDRHHARPCSCRRSARPHQHCAHRGCAAISASAKAVDPWPVEDRLAGYPEPREWHCPEHRWTTTPCVGADGVACGTPVRAVVSCRVVRCDRCRRLAEQVAGGVSRRPA